MDVDNAVIELFQNRIKQVFVYVTNRCQLHCKQCLYKPLLQKNSADISYTQIEKLLIVFREFGAYKLTFIGGEPTLYEDEINKKHFSDLVVLGKELEYKYIRFDTNGQFSNDFLYDKKMHKIDEITFSIDGFAKEYNDIIRGDGSFEKCVNNIKLAVKEKYKVQITVCVHKNLLPDAVSGYNNIKLMIQFAESLNVQSINFHPIFKVGVDRDSWIENTDINIEDWLIVYEKIYKEIALGTYKNIDIRLPMRFISEDGYLKNKEKYSYCPVELGERALIMPDGTIKICAFMIGTDYSVANYNENSIWYTEHATNEVERKNNGSQAYDACVNQKIEHSSSIPLCMSYKPEQNEIVWNDITLLKVGQ